MAGVWNKRIRGDARLVLLLQRVDVGIKLKPIPESEAMQIIALPKEASPRLVWSEDENHHGSRLIEFGVRTPGHRGLLIELMARQHKYVAGRVTLELGLLRRDFAFQHFERVYQLAIDGAAFVTHRESGQEPTYGAHELFGDRTNARPELNDLGFSDALGVFLSTINLILDDEPIPDPFEFRLK